jgi:hypothetical protein
MENQTQIKEKLSVGHYYNVECYDKDGNLKWTDEFENIVVTSGRNHYLDATLKTGVAAPVWYVGLKNTVDAVAADTIASKGFTEITAYSEATRPVYTPGTIASGSVDNSASKAEFNINGTTTVGGAFLVNNNTKGGTTGILLGAGEFAADRAVISGDIIRVTVTCSITSV